MPSYYLWTFEGEEGVFDRLNEACSPGGRENPKYVFILVKKK
jgi:hypothetical protein